MYASIVFECKNRTGQSERSPPVQFGFANALLIGVFAVFVLLIVVDCVAAHAEQLLYTVYTLTHTRVSLSLPPSLQLS